jgi:anti-sigma regulatory factor (Ser/Thr protein kinase)
MKNIFAIEVPAEHKYLQVIRSFYTQCLQGIGMDAGKNEIVYLEMAVNEFCENIIRHGYKGNAGEITIKLVIGKKSISTVILDRGQPHNILEYDPIAKETLVEKGIQGKLGIRMIKTICSNIHYKRLKGRNKTVLVKKIRK